MTTRMNRRLAIAITLALSNLTFGGGICAADRSQSPRPAPRTELRKTETPAPLFQTPQDRQSEKQYPAQELEQLRSKLLELVDTVKEYSDLLLPDNPELGGKLAAVRKQFEQYNPQQLNVFRVSFATSTAADVIFIAAAGVRAGLSRGCNQVLVVLGEGCNSSLACVAADVVYYAALAVRAKLAACDLDYVGRTVDGSFSRLEHLNTDLENSVANDNANKNTIVSNISSSQTAIIGNANTNTTTITNNANANTLTITGNDNANKTTIVNNDNANKTAITNAISASQAAVNANTNAGKDELRDLIRRTQIEANLAEEPGKGFVGLYVTPSANGGFLELVRAIVVDTIAKLGGKKTAEANKQLAQGDAQKALGNFNKAYSYYRQAYRTAVRED